MVNKYLEDFITYTVLIKGRTEGTAKIYESTLKELFDFLYNDRNIDLEQPITKEFLETIDKNDGRKYLLWCAKKGNNAATRNRKVVTIRTFFAYLEDTEGIYSNITQLEAAKTKKTLPKYLSEKEAFELLENAKNNKRDYAIIFMFLTCGLRVSEMASLNRDDIRPDNTMIITGKGDKQRKIWLTQECIDAINEYMNTRDDKCECLWVNKDGNRISKIGIQFMIKKYLESIGREDCSVHKLRHTFATLMYQSGSADILQLQQMLGHNNIATTQIYTHIADETLGECVKHNPLLKNNMKEI